MRKRFITRDLEVWLYENYSHMSNQELAEEFAARLKNDSPKRKEE